MSRPFTASLSVVPVSLAVRLAPPVDLTPEQAALWVTTVDSKPVEWFGEDTAPLLAEYVRAAAMCNALERQLQAVMATGDPVDTALLMKGFLDMRDKESKRLLSIATKLRLTQQSRYTPKAANTANNRVGAGAKPWQYGKG